MRTAPLLAVLLLSAPAFAMPFYSGAHEEAVEQVTLAGGSFLWSAGLLELKANPAVSHVGPDWIDVVAVGSFPVIVMACWRLTTPGDRLGGLDLGVTAAGSLGGVALALGAHRFGWDCWIPGMRCQAGLKPWQ